MNEQSAIAMDRLLAILRDKRHTIELSRWEPGELLELRDRAHDAKCLDLVSMADFEIVRRMTPKPAECDHVWEADGDRDVCKKCGSRANPAL